MFVELLLTTTITLFVYAIHKWIAENNDYFKRRGLKSLKPTFLIGNAGTIMTRQYTATEFSKKLYNDFPDEPIYGAFDFRNPTYIFRDLEAIKQICVKDFDHFENHRPFTTDDIDELWGNSLFLLKGKKWHDMRATLSPAFTGNKMRQMFDLVSECAEDYMHFFLSEAKGGKKINIELKETFSCYTNDVIASCAFGLKINSLSQPDNDFLVNGKKVMDFGSLTAIAKLVIINQWPKVARAFNIKVLSDKIANLFKSIILGTMEKRKNHNIYRPDMINILMQVRDGNLKLQPDAKSNGTNDGFATVEESEVGKTFLNRKWNDNEVVAQCFIFFLAGFETLSTTLSFASYELMLNPDFQRKLYEEIAETNARLGGKQITYDTLQKMKYLDQVICEVLRKWPPALNTERLCSRDYVFDDGDKLKFKIEKGRQLFVPIYGIQNDPNYFAEPEKFDPERFNDENKKKIIPGAYMPFGIGPRACIGSRFALMELKAILYYLLLNFSFEANEKTDIPVKLEKNPFFLQTNGMHLQLKPRKNTNS